MSLPLFHQLFTHCIRLLYGDNYNSKDHIIIESLSTIFSGFLAGVFGGFLNTPFDTIRTIIQKNYFTGKASGSLLSVGRDIVNVRGYKSLYAGFGVKACHLGGGGALMSIFLPLFKHLFNQ